MFRIIQYIPSNMHTVFLYFPLFFFILLSYDLFTHIFWGCFTVTWALVLPQCHCSNFEVYTYRDRTNSKQSTTNSEQCVNLTKTVTIRAFSSELIYEHNFKASFWRHHYPEKQNASKLCSSCQTHGDKFCQHGLGNIEARACDSSALQVVKVMSQETYRGHANLISSNRPETMTPAVDVIYLDSGIVQPVICR